MKLLLIEDNPTMQATLQRTLERRGMQVLTCDDGSRALALWQASLPDAVLLDLSLPGRDGLQVLADARTDGLATPVIILTARGTVGDRILGLNAGADDYLPKPVSADTLQRILLDAALAAPAAPADPGDDASIESPTMIPLHRLEWEHIQQALNETGGNISATARLLGMHRRSLQRKLAKRPGPERRPPSGG